MESAQRLEKGIDHLARRIRLESLREGKGVPSSYIAKAEAARRVQHDYSAIDRKMLAHDVGRAERVEQAWNEVGTQGDGSDLEALKGVVGDLIGLVRGMEASHAEVVDMLLDALEELQGVRHG